MERFFFVSGAEGNQGCIFIGARMQGKVKGSLSIYCGSGYDWFSAMAGQT